jgi:hypothetical protein
LTGTGGVLVDEFIEEVTVLPDYLDVNVHGAPAMHVLYQEVGMKDSGFDQCRRGDLNPHALAGTSPSIRISPLVRTLRFAFALFRASHRDTRRHR